MIISHKYKFIFLKTSKTAGTSIEIALSKFCNENDVITPISPKDELVRADLGYKGPQNYMFPLSDYKITDWVNVLFKYKNKRWKQFYNHITAQRVQNMIDSNIWNTYYKFCFERNPWDRVVSQYYWRISEPRISMKLFLKSKHFKDLIKKGRNVYTVNNRIAVDKIYKYEFINDAIIDLSEKFKFAKKLELPRTKSTSRPKKREYSDILNSDEKKYIGKVFEKEIINLDYEF